MMWLKANIHVNKMDLKTKKVPLMLIFLPNDVDDKDGWSGRDGMEVVGMVWKW